ncbi:MAG: hypothetical protein K8H90_07515, partial [Thermoanaerobaculia bacterium]|nr:hypothetical protein [Thermoanaerobaculia bacterium]
AWSHDGGVTWTFVALGTPADATGVTWQDEDRVWVSGTLPAGWSAAGVLLGSDNGGLTWAAVVSDHPVPLTSVAFADPTHGFAGQPGDGLLATTNGGLSWSSVGHPGLGLADVEFVDPLVGHAAGTGLDFTLQRTTDGGAGWTPVYECPTGTITGLSFPGGATGFLASPVEVAGSIDGGAIWTHRATLSGVWLDDLVFADATTGWLAGSHQLGNDQRGLVLATTDGGLNWADTGLDEPDRVAALALTATDALIAAGSGGTLLRSDDAGASWGELAGASANHFRDLLMEGAGAGWAAGPVGAVHRTTDGGTSWAAKGGLGTGTLEAIVRAAPGVLFACGSYALVASADDGASWQTRHTSIDCHALRFADALDGIAGTRYGVWWTDDGGFTWTLADGAGLGLGGVFDFAFLDGDHGFAAAGIGTILETVDGGLTWAVAHAEPPGFNSYLYGIDFSSATHGIAVGMDGAILTTGDGGATWDHRTSGVAVHLRDVAALSALEALAVGEGGTVLFSGDGGVTWAPADSGTAADLWSIKIAADGTPLIAGDWGTILAPALPPQIFADGFECGNSSAWSAAVP